MNTVKKQGKPESRLRTKLEHHQYAGCEDNWKKLYKVLSAEETLEYFKSVNQQEENRKKRKLLFLSIAACAIVLIAIGITIRYNNALTSDELVIVATDSIVYHVLPDGSEIWLNRNSTLSSIGQFKKGSREVYLLGEAFFKVSHHSEDPFRVHTELATVEVLGTEFNVKAYTGQQTETVSVLQGKVSVCPQNGTALILEDLEKCAVHTEDTAAVEERQGIQHDFSWKTHAFTFSNEPIQKVVDVIGSAYHRPVILDGVKSDSLCLSATYFDMNLEEIVHTICLTLDLQYSNKNDTLVITE